MAYRAGVHNCLNICDSGKHFVSQKAKLWLKDYYYVGGYQGAADEFSIMQEIFKHGPVVANIEPTFDFQLYKKGIFKPLAGNTWQSYKPQDKSIGGRKILEEWTKVDHAVLIYGWGETKSGVKYWRVMNSWGDRWGVKGAFKVVRGNNSIGIESVVEAGQPDIERI